jgi:hypothetical protein
MLEAQGQQMGTKAPFICKDGAQDDMMPVSMHKNHIFVQQHWPTRALWGAVALPHGPTSTHAACTGNKYDAYALEHSNQSPEQQWQQQLCQQQCGQQC